MNKEQAFRTQGVKFTFRPLIYKRLLNGKSNIRKARKVVKSHIFCFSTNPERVVNI